MMNQRSDHHSKPMKQLLTLLLAAGMAIQGFAASLGTAFTYQGRLSDNGQPAEGVYDFVFVLYASPEADVPVWSGILKDDVTVAQGRFVTEVDFGADLFDGTELWLEVAVRPGDETGDVTPLTPRHHLTATPYAHFARRAAVATTAESVAAVPWSAITELPEALADGANLPVYSAGAGIGLNEQNQLSVQFAGSGNAESAARSDHDHFGQQWTGVAAQAPGLRIHNTSHSGIGLWAKNDEWGSGFSPAFGAAVFGDSTSDPGVAGFSNTGPGVYGWTSALNINAPAVVGENNSVTGSVVFGHAKAKTGTAAGVLGQSEAVTGIGVKGVTTALVNANTVAGWFEAATGTGVFGRAQYGPAGHFSLTNLNNTSAALLAESSGKGSAGSFQIHNPQNTKEVLGAWGNGTGASLKSVAAGNGQAGYFFSVGTGKGVEVMTGNGVGVDVSSTGNHAISASASAQNTVRAINTGGKAAVSGNSPSGRGVEGLTTTGAAVHAYASNGTAVQARAPGGTALEIDGGALQRARASTPARSPSSINAPPPTRRPPPGATR
jgi:hypothetical protein